MYGILELSWQGLAESMFLFHGMSLSATRCPSPCRAPALSLCLSPIAPLANLALLSAHCLLDMDTGTHCKDFVQHWYFNKAMRACSPFWYGGCDGNHNRFGTESECFQACTPTSKLHRETSKCLNR